MGQCREHRGCQVCLCCCVYITICGHTQPVLPATRASRKVLLSCPSREWRGSLNSSGWAEESRTRGSEWFLMGFPFVVSRLIPALLSKVFPCFLVLLSCLIAFLSLVS